MPTRKRTAAKKKAAKKKTAVRAPRKKTAKKKPALKRSPSKSGARKKSPARRASASVRTSTLKEPVTIEPGPPPGNIPPVEEPTQQETAVGVVTHYYSHLGVAVIQINTGTLRSGNTIHIKGHTTDFAQAVASMEYEHQHVDEATAGQSVGIKTVDHAREHDIVFVVK